MSAIIDEINLELSPNDNVLFCGAGISHYSNIPIARSIITSVLKGFKIPEKDIELVLKSDIPFELFIELLSESLDITNLLGIFSADKPNSNHILIAKLAKKGLLSVICTTNFDTLIEQAFISEGMEENIDYKVLYKAKDISKYKLDDNCVTLIKLHGSIVDKEDLAITLKKVSQKQMKDSLERVIKKIFFSGQHNRVIILGYSCSDIFDISPLIEELGQSSIQILLINYIESLSNHSEKIEPIGRKSHKNPFKLFKNGHRVSCNTEKVIKKIWARNLECQYLKVKSKNKNHTWYKRVKRFTKSADRFEIDSIMGKLFFQISNYPKSIEYYKNSIDVIDDKDLEKYGLVHSDLGLVYREYGDCQKALDSHKVALNISKKLKIEEDIISDLGNIGVTYHNLGLFDKARNTFEESFTYKSFKEILSNKPRLINNYGYSLIKLGKIKRGINISKSALKSSRELGDKRGEERILATIGIGYFEYNKFLLAIKYYKLAKKIAENIGDIDGICLSHNNIGSAYFRINEYGKAMSHYESLLKHRKLEELNARKLGNISNVYFKLNKQNEAFDLIDMAIKKSTSAEELHIVAGSYNIKGTFFLETRDFANSLKCFLRSLRFYKKVNDLKNLSTVNKNIGTVYLEKEKYIKAMDYLTQALSLTKKVFGKNSKEYKGLKNDLKMLQNRDEFSSSR